MAKQEHTDQIELNDIPKQRGRPKSGKALSAAERQKRYRIKKKKTDQVEVRRFVSEKTAFNLETLEKKGVNLEDIIEQAMTIKFGKQPGN